MNFVFEAVDVLNDVFCFLLFIFYFHSKDMSTPKVYDYINSLIDMLDESEKFKKCDFSILCDRYPIPGGKSAYKAKVIYI